jgi:hypothetical protein
MTDVTRWVFDYGGANHYSFPRNPDRYGGDTYWIYEPRMTEIEVIGASLPSIQIDSFAGARRTVRFTAITGAMMRALQDFYFRAEIIENCRDHLYSTTPSFDCFIVGFNPTVHPTSGDFPGTGEDTWDLEMTLMRMS